MEEKDYFISIYGQIMKKTYTINNFDTPIYNMDASVAGQSFNVRVGNLPPMLEGALIGLSGTAGVIGYDFFNRFKVQLDYANHMLHLA